MFRRKFLTAAIVAAVALLAGPSVSQAAFEIKLEQLNVTTGAVIGSATIIADGGAGDTDGAADNITYGTTTLFGLTIKITATATEASGGSTLSEVNANIQNGTSADVRIRITTSRQYTQPSGQNLNLSASASVNGTNNNGFSGTYNAYVDKQGDLFGTDVLVRTGSVSPGSGTLPGGGGVLANPGSNWALTEVFDVTYKAGGRSTGLTGDMTVTGTDDAPTLDAPAPGGLVMALTAVPFLGLIRRRLRKSEAAA